MAVDLRTRGYNGFSPVRQHSGIVIAVPFDRGCSTHVVVTPRAVTMRSDSILITYLRSVSSPPPSLPSPHGIFQSSPPSRLASLRVATPARYIISDVLTSYLTTWRSCCHTSPPVSPLSRYFARYTYILALTFAHTSLVRQNKFLTSSSHFDRIN